MNWLIFALAILAPMLIGAFLGALGMAWWDRRRQYPRRPNPYWADYAGEGDDRARDVP